MCTEEQTTVSIAYYYQKNFYLKAAIDQDIQRLLSGGIVQRWYNFLSRGGYAQSRAFRESEASVLELSHFNAIFVVMIVGMLCSCFVFFVEIWAGKVKSWKN